MPITPAFSALVNEASAVTLARYAQIIEYDECAFFGVDPGNLDQLDCRTIWIKSERDNIAKYLAEAQLEIENQVGFFLSPRWVVGQLSDEPDGNSRLVDGGREWALPLVTRWAEVIAGGVRAESTISAGETVSHAADPAVIGPVATTVTDPDEIRIYHPGTDIEMNPSKITISGGNVTIEIPRCRTVTEAAADNDRSGLDYSDTGPGGPFEQTVDIKRVYNSEATQAVLVFPHQCDAICAANGCAESTQDACIYVRDPRLGIIDVVPADYSGGTWTQTSLDCCQGGALVRLNYYAGKQYLSRQMEDAIVRLAHAKMPDEPCGCDVAQRMWKRDRNVPEVLTRERINCPFGMSDGAWIAWQFTRSFKQMDCFVF